MTPQPPNCVASRRGFTDHMLRSVGICLAALLFLLDDVSGHELEPVSVCPTRSIPANKSGIITYDSTSGGCTLTLTGLQSGVRISLMGVTTTAADAELCNSLGFTSVRLNGLADLNCATTKVDIYKNVIAITGSDELTLEVVAPGSAAIQTPYFPAYRCGGSDAMLYYPNEVGGLTATYTSQLYGKSVPDAEDCNSTMTGLPAGQTVRFTTSVKIFTEKQASLTANGIELAGEGEFTDVPVPDNQRIDIQYASHALATPRAEYFFYVEVLTCDFPPESVRRNISSLPKIPWIIGTMMEYRCERGYEVEEDNSMRVCERTSDSDPQPRWSQNNITCVPGVLCPHPPDVEHGSSTADPDIDYFYMDSVIYTCDIKYSPTDKQSSQCQSDGGWHPTPRCSLNEDKGQPTNLHASSTATILAYSTGAVVVVLALAIVGTVF